MASTIDFGIDLGTSNSLIARFDKGHVDIFRNPNGFKETLPSVVGFRNDRILVGDQARTYAERDPKSVVGRFKRKMGTSETFKIKVLNESKSPVELSSFVLRELKTFIHTGEQTDSVVITIPASFDTVQSNATKEAGAMAGFKTVLLLQEPIAASLAYANKEKNVDLQNSQWLVYDLGGGTFDVALVRILEGELTVLDHEGDNYLGGTDFDALMVESILVPELEKRGKFRDLLAQMRSESGRYNELWYSLLRRCEDAKVELSSKTSAEIDLGTISRLEDDDGKAIDAIITVTRSEFESVLKDAIDRTTEMMKKILTRNSLQASDIKFVLMVGGSTYIPYVRKRVAETLGIEVNTSIDPTNAVVVGAAYFAGSREKISIGQPKTDRSASDLRIRASYNRTSQHTDETFMAKVEGQIEGLQYRITSADGAYDSGLKRLKTRIVEDLTLRENAYNFFTFKLYDAQGNPVHIEFDNIQIAQGRYAVAGQLLPEDIALVKDDLISKDTRLDLVFAKNAVLPTKAKKSVEVARTTVKDATDEVRIVLVEGPSNRHSSTNKPIGILSITGKHLSRDLIKGTEVDLTFSMSESRELTVSAYLNGTSQEFSQVFTPSKREVSTQLLASEILLLETKIRQEIEDAEKNGNRKTADGLEKLTGEVESLIGEAAELSDDDVTDRKYQLEDKKRLLAQEMFELTSSKRLEQAKARYVKTRDEVFKMVLESGNDRERHIVSEVRAREQTFINSINPEKMHSASAELDRVRWQILFRTPQFLIDMFEVLVSRRTSMNDQQQATQCIDTGRRAISAESWEELHRVNDRLWDLMPAAEQASEELRMYTGIV